MADEQSKQIVAEATQQVAQGIFDGDRGALLKGVKTLIEFLRGVDFDQINTVLREIMDAVEDLLGAIGVSAQAADEALIQEAVSQITFPGPTAQMNIGSVVEFVKILMAFISLFKDLKGEKAATVIEAAGTSCCSDPSVPASECSQDADACETPTDDSDAVDSDDE